MNELTLLSKEEPGVVAIENFHELKEVLTEQMERYQGLVFTEDSVKSAKDTRKELNALRKNIEDKRKSMKKSYMAPFEEVEAQLKELAALVDEPLNLIKAFLSETESEEKAEKRGVIFDFYMKNASALGGYAERIFNSPTFYEKKWDNKSTKTKEYQDAVLEKIETISSELSSLQETGGKHTPALLEKYCESLSFGTVLTYKKTLEKSETLSQSKATLVTSKNRVVGFKTLKLTGTEQQLSKIMEQIKLIGVDVEVIEDSFSQGLEELEQPNFDTFIAFDIETSGTYGADMGDEPAEITEIGAVKVKNGKIVDRFSMLANPERRIIRRISRLTGITNEMVENEPSINEVIGLFHEFVEDYILVGHNIKSSDLPYIKRAGERNGIAFTNQFFDTYLYAAQFKQQENWEKLRLGYLSEVFGITLQNAHRAWCDAEANAEVYFKLKEMRKHE